MEKFLSDLNKKIPFEIDLTKEEDSSNTADLAGQILDKGATFDELYALEKDFSKRKDISLRIQLALKLAISKKLVLKLKKPLKVSVCFAMYKEHNRIKRCQDHPHGENFLFRKVSQLHWLFDDTPHIEWKMFLVDDGCPEGCGRIAEQMIKDGGLSGSVEVAFLEQAIQSKSAVVADLESSADSQKGGSIHLGLWNAMEQGMGADHIAVYTDADMSTHLGQIGLLLSPIVEDGKLAAIGSRRESASIVIKKGTRNTRGKLFIYLWKRLLKPLNYLTDTQCGFKAFKAEILPELLKSPIERKFAFDIELLLKTENIQKGSIAKVPVAWFDSEAASTTTDLSPYLPMLKKIVEMYRTYLPEGVEEESFAGFIDDLSEEQWNHLVENVPAEIADGDPAVFDAFDKIKPGDFDLLRS